MPKLLTINSKMSKTAKKRGVKVMNFGTPAGFGADLQGNRFKTCPNMGLCAKGCFAKQSAYTWAPVRNAYQWRLEQSLRPDFQNILCEAIIENMSTDKQLYIRIHDSGDFHGLDNILDWLEVIAEFPQVQFYAYTKMVSAFKLRAGMGQIPDNLTIIYSYGGVEDHLIDPVKDRHSAVFATDRELRDAGYTSAMEDDLLATEHLKVGLVYHGAKSKQWTKKGNE